MSRYVMAFLAIGLVAPALLLAQSISVDTPTPPAPGAGSMKHIVNLKNLPNVNSGNFAVGPADTGIILAKKGVNNVCSVALSSGWTITPILGCAPFTAAGCCATAADVTIIFNVTQGALGFTVTKLIGDAKFSISPVDAGTILFGVNSQTNAGNNLGQDLKSNFLVMVDPAGVNGNVNFFVDWTGGPTKTFSVNTSAFIGDPDGLANAIAAGYIGTGLGLPVSVHEAIVADKYSRNPAEFTTCFVQIRPVPATVTEFRVQGLVGQRIVEENNDGTISIPALSLWGVAALVGTILITSFWFLRRRRQVVGS